MHFLWIALLFAPIALASAQQPGNEGNFTIVNGQVYTPGLAIIDAPQPFTPEGGDFLQVAIDISGDGRIPLPPYTSPDFSTGFVNLTIFLTSYTTGLNLTISNGTASGWVNSSSSEPIAFACNANTTTATSSTGSNNFQNAGCQEILLQEPSSTVKHVNWVWPDCLVGNGDNTNNGQCGSNQASSSVKDCLNGNARGAYNISLHQSFRFNGTSFYTVFDLPINVTNSIPNTTQQSSDGTRPKCALRNNPLLSPEMIAQSVTPLKFQPWLGGNISVSGGGSGSSGTNAGGRGFDIDLKILWGFLAGFIVATVA